MNEEERIRKAIEEERQRAILEKIEQTNKRTMTEKETERYKSLGSEIEKLKQEITELNDELNRRRIEYQEQLKRENLKPLIGPMYFTIIVFGILDVFFMYIFKNIFEQTPILKYLWIVCIVFMVALYTFQIVYLKNGKKKRTPMREKMLRVEEEISKKQMMIQKLEEEQRKV